MPVVRHFVGWDRPLVEAVRDFIIPAPPDQCVDLSDTLILVPTRQAGRRLTDALALTCAKAGTALLACRTATPSVLLKFNPRPTVATAIDVQAAWIETLTDADTAALPGLFPSPPAELDADWALRLGAMIQELRHALVEAGLTIDTLVRTRSEDLEELDRWRDLATLERAYLAAVARHGLRDPCCQILAAMQTPAIEDGVRRIVVAAIPDPTEPARRALEHLSEALDIDILVAAPEQRADTFDPWGRPIVEAWTQCSLAIPDPQTRIVLSAAPADQAATAIALLQRQSNTGAAAALGTPDRALIPHLQAAIQEQGGTAFDPADRPLREHALYHLVAAWLNLVTERSYTALARLLRQPDVMMRIDADQPGYSTQVLRRLDVLQNEHLPWDLAAVQHWADTDSAPDGLRPTIDWVAGSLPASQDTLASALRAFLQSVFERHTIQAGRPQDDEFERAARIVDEAIHELSATEARPTTLGQRARAMLLLRRLGDAGYHRERAPDAIDIDGWLELAWNPAPVLVIAGVNEGTAPSAPSPNALLTDSLRLTLGMRSDADGLARDSFLLQSMIKARGARGAAWLITGKVSDSGDPLRPSRLLLRCNDDELPARARQLFRPVSTPRTRPAATCTVRLDPARVPAPPPIAGLSVTAFRDYLACPFRFYLKHVLGMEARDDAKRAPDVRDFGIMIHDALQRMGESAAMRDGTHAPTLAVFLTDCAERWIRRHYGAAPALPIRMTLHAAQQRLESAARVQCRLAAEGWEIIAVEHPFEQSIGGFIVRGKIDRIDRHRDSGALRVIDYKTSDNANDPAKAHLAAVRDDTPEFATVSVAGKARRWTDLQLPLYAILGADTAEAPPEPAYFDLPRAVSGTAIRPWPTFDADLAGAAYATAEAIAESIVAGRFWPPAEQITYDDFESLFRDGSEGWHPITEPT